MFLHRRKITLVYALICGLVAGFQTSAAVAWDATGHRLTAYIAWEFMSTPSKEQALAILRAHPRFDTDFMNAMPDNIRVSDSRQQDRWLFGQAAIWPDIARGFTGADSRRFDHPEWHWIDGAWVRDEATRQGNLYVNTETFSDINGIAAERIQRRSQAENVVTALDLAVYELNNGQAPADQALALCWFLHLTGDIHQPLHTGALVSARLFAQGDRGGNGIRVRSGTSGSNLHAVWDSALQGPSLESSLQALLNIAGDIAANEQLSEYAPTRWLQESRDHLLSSVYPDAVISDVLRSENTGNQLGTIALSEAYQEQMRMIAAQRIAEAGVRIAHTLENL
jgi:hypothetical protein